MKAAARAKTRGGWTPTGTSARRRRQVARDRGPKSSRTRRAILDAARTVFARQGYLDTTVELIVDEAGISRGSFYTYFESKVDVLRTLAAGLNEEFANEVVAFPRPGSDAVTNLAASTRNYLEVVRRNADIYRLMDHVSLFDDEIRRTRLSAHQGHVARVAETIRRWQERGIADTSVDPDTTANALVSMQSSMARWIFVEGDEIDAEAARATLVDVWVRACGLRSPERGGTFVTDTNIGARGGT
jgi:AcrR family transcriptional regulator